VRILFVGDVVGRPGRRVLKKLLPHLRRELLPDLVIANGENCAGGIGMTPNTVQELFGAGCDVVTGGNHTWDRKEIVPLLDRSDRILRPANYPEPAPGRGVALVRAADGTEVAVLNLMGRVFMGALEDPFRTADRILQSLGGRPPVVVVDFHAEATSEKMALGWYLDGRVSAIVGTHTHVPTADERVSKAGTAYITDVGMTGPYDSVIGVEKADVLARFLTQRPCRFSTAKGDVRLSAVLLEIRPQDGRAERIERLSVCEGTS
jgi:hypothetical protein